MRVSNLVSDIEMHEQFLLYDLDGVHEVGKQVAFLVLVEPHREFVEADLAGIVRVNRIKQFINRSIALLVNSCTTDIASKLTLVHLFGA